MNNSESQKKLYKCTKCEFKHLHKRSLTAHMRRLHSQVNRKFKHTQNLTKHTYIHSHETSYRCAFCKDVFAQSVQLKRHVISVHKKEKPRPCPICAEKSRNIFEEEDTNTDDGVYPCSLCECKFNDSDSLNAHKQVHLWNKPFACEICDAKYTKRSNLVVHMRYHSGERPYSCSSCESKFVRQCDLKIHMKTCHSGKRPFTCKYCKSNFKTTRDIKHHIQNIHGAYVIKELLPSLGKKDSSEENRSEEKILLADFQDGQKVKVISIYACVTCKAKFKELSNLKTHMRSHVSLNVSQSDCEAKPTRFELD